MGPRPERREPTGEDTKRVDGSAEKEDDTMSDWSISQLDSIADAQEVQLASRRPDATLRSFVTIWGVRVGQDVLVRSAYGADNGWYRRALVSGLGRLRVAGIEREVTFTRVEPAEEVHVAVDAAYHAKYDRYGAGIVGSVVGAQAAQVTVRITPTDD